MISRLIDWCAANRFMVFTSVAFLTFGGLWSIQRVPLDAYNAAILDEVQISNAEL